MSMDEYSGYDDRRPAPRTNIWPLVMLAILLGAVVWRFWPAERGSGLDPSATPRPIVARGDLAEDEKATIELYRRVAPSVVHVTRIAQGVDSSWNILQVSSGMGSGFIWDEDGHVVTNNHVVAGADSLQVVLADHSKWTGRVVGTDASSDVAVLKIDAPKSQLHPIMVGTSHDLQVGQKAYAIGNPFGLDQTLTTGVVSALDREIPGHDNQILKGVIQTNAAINPGNSGGPLLDSAGRLIGINAAIVSPSGTSAGIGFAIPVDEVNRQVTQLIRHGKVPRPGIGVRPASDRFAEDHGIDDGVLIFFVMPDSPAEKAGLRPTRRVDNGDVYLGDIIIGMDDKPIHNTQDLFVAVDSHKTGDTVHVKIRRDDKQLSIPITLQAIR